MRKHLFSFFFFVFHLSGFDLIINTFRTSAFRPFLTFNIASKRFIHNFYHFLIIFSASPLRHPHKQFMLFCIPANPIQTGILHTHLCESVIWMDNDKRWGVHIINLKRKEIFIIIFVLNLFLIIQIVVAVGGACVVLCYVMLSSSLLTLECKSILILVKWSGSCVESLNLTDINHYYFWGEKK